MGDDEPTWGPLRRAFRAAVAFFGHLCFSLLFVTGIWLLEQHIRLLYGQEEPMLYDRIPLKWLFHTMDLGILIVFVVWGVIEAHRKLRG